jgi:hypothetical protein
VAEREMPAYVPVESTASCRPSISFAFDAPSENRPAARFAAMSISACSNCMRIMFAIASGLSTLIIVSPESTTGT